MKAKDYATRFKANPTSEHLGEIYLEFLAEIDTIAKMRHTTDDDAITAIVDEQANKWRSFARLTDGMVVEDGFVNILKSELPEIYESLMLRRKRGIRHE